MRQRFAAKRPARPPRSAGRRRGDVSRRLGRSESSHTARLGGTGRRAVRLGSFDHATPRSGRSQPIGSLQCRVPTTRRALVRWIALRPARSKALAESARGLIAPAARSSRAPETTRIQLEFSELPRASDRVCYDPELSTIIGRSCSLRARLRGPLRRTDFLISTQSPEVVPPVHFEQRSDEFHATASAAPIHAGRRMHAEESIATRAENSPAMDGSSAPTSRRALLPRRRRVLHELGPDVRTSPGGSRRVDMQGEEGR